MDLFSRRCVLTLVALALGGLLTSGCAGLARPSDLRPASHPLLEGVAPRTRLLPLAHRARSKPATRAERTETREARPTRPTVEASGPPRSDGPAAAAARKAIAVRLGELDGKRQIDERPASDIALLRAALYDIDGVQDPGDSLAETRRASRPVGRPMPGDLAFFDGAGGAAEVAIVRNRRDDGAIEALAVTRGAVRPIVVHPGDPHTRRRAGRVVNTFLRARRKGDEASAVYLAGQLLIDFRTLID